MCNRQENLLDHWKTDANQVHCHCYDHSNQLLCNQYKYICTCKHLGFQLKLLCSIYLVILLWKLWNWKCIKKSISNKHTIKCSKSIKECMQIKGNEMWRKITGFEPVLFEISFTQEKHIFFCNLLSRAAHRDYFFRHWSVCLNDSHNFLVVTIFMVVLKIFVCIFHIQLKHVNSKSMGPEEILRVIRSSS